MDQIYTESLTLAETINILLNNIYGVLPSYCYYTDFDNFSPFFNNLKNHDYKKIYKFLKANRMIATKHKDIVNIKKNIVCFFQNKFGYNIYS